MSGSGEERDPRITWGGHATVRIELDGSTFITDPVFRNRVVHLKRQVPTPAFDLRQPVDAILISHAHFDHLDPPSLRRFHPDTQVLVPTGAGDLLTKTGFHRIRELEPGETAVVGSIQVRAVEALHDGRRHPLSHTDRAIGFELSGSRNVYFAGDTDIFPGMSELADRIDLALLPIWGWGHRLGPGHMDPQGAARAAALLRPQLTVPIHWGTYFPMGMKGVRGRLLKTPAVAFSRQMEELAPELDFRVLEPGQSVNLPSRRQ